MVNTAGPNNTDWPIGRRKGLTAHGGGSHKDEKRSDGNGAIYVQEYAHGEVCNHKDVADAVVKGKNVERGGVERSSTVRFSCGNRLELVKVEEDRTCHYVLDVTVPELRGHRLFRAKATRMQVVKRLPV